MQIAHAQGVPICTIVNSIANECPGLAQSSLLTAGITFALWQGLEVLVPQTPITVIDWQGGAYIARDPVTKEGYLFVIEAGLNGGSTIADVWAGNNWATILFKGCTLPGSTLMVSPKQVTSPPPDSYWPEQKGYIPRWFASAWRVFMFLPGDASLRPAITIEYDVCQASDPLNPLHIKEVLYPHFAPEPGDYRIATDWNFLTQMDLAESNYLNYTIYGVEVETPDGLYAPINGDAITLTANVIPRMPPGGAVQWAVDEWYGEGNGTFGTPMTTSTTFSGTTPGFLNVNATVSNENGLVSDDQRLYAFGVEMVDASSEYMAKGYSAYPLIGDPTPVTYTYRIVPDDFPLVVSPAFKELHAIVSQQITTVLTHTFDLVSNELLAGPNLWSWDGKDNNGLYVDPDTYQTRFQLTAPNHKRAFSQPRDTNVVEVTKVEFLDSNGNLITDPNNHPDFPGGVRIFPDKPTPGEERKNQIKVRATLNTSVTVGTLGIAFKSFDLEDPSGLITTNHPLTTTTLVIPAEGLLNPAIGLTDGDNTVEVTFTVTMQPGDNFKVLASTNSAMLTALSTDVITTNTDSSGTTTLAELQPLASERLTVWRKLHVEVDSMGSVGIENEIMGNVITVTNYGVTSTVITDQNLNEVGWAGRFANGIMRNYAIDFQVISNTVGANFTVIVQNSGVVTPTIGPFVLFDDDDFNNDDGVTRDGDVGEDITRPDTILIQDSDIITENILAGAYIRPTYDIGDNNNSVTFQLNLPDGSDESSLLQANYDFDQSATEADNDFWTVYLLGAYQHQTTRDFDPNSEVIIIGGNVLGPVLGQVDAIKGVGATIFNETIHEATPSGGACGEASVVAHEIGHLMNARHDDGEIMHRTCNYGTGNFSQASLIKFRELDHP